MNDPKRILVVAAHPDDEILGCGAVMARLSRKAEVNVLILGEGLTSRHDRREEADPTALERLRVCARKAARTVGAKSVGFADFPDNRFDEVPLLEVVKRIEKEISAGRPDTVFTHHPGDLNIDHQISFRAVLTATRPMEGSPVKALYAFEIPSSSEWSFQKTGPAFRPDVFIDVTRTLETKIRALKAYAGEIRRFPHPRSPEALRAIARRWGSTVGVRAAEAFELIRSIC